MNYILGLGILITCPTVPAAMHVTRKPDFRDICEVLLIKININCDYIYVIVLCINSCLLHKKNIGLSEHTIPNTPSIQFTLSSQRAWSCSSSAS